MAKLNIYYLFPTALVLIGSRRRKKKKLEKEEEGVSGFDLHLPIEQLAVLLKA